MDYPEIKKEWIAKLRSGEYKQIKKWIQDAEGYCCLGVLCYAVSVEAYYELSDQTCITLINMNDEEGKTFHEIADWIEEHL